MQIAVSCPVNIHGYKKKNIFMPMKFFQIITNKVNNL